MAKRHMKRFSTLLVIKRNANQNYNEVSLHLSQNGYHQKKSISSKGWRGCGEKGIFVGTLCGTKPGIVTMENSKKVPKKTKSRATI